MAVWAFDVDGCLIDSLSGSSLRPGAAEILACLRADGHHIVLWSAGGAEYAFERAQLHGIATLVDEFHAKEERDQHGRYLASRFAEVIGDVVFVDDRPEDMPVGATVVAVSPYLSHNPHDRALERVMQTRRPPG